jgi:hypothetical protein
VSTAVVRRSDGSETLLARRVPLKSKSEQRVTLYQNKAEVIYDLQLHRLAIKFNGSDFL